MNRSLVIFIRNIFFIFEVIAILFHGRRRVVRRVTVSSAGVHGRVVIWRMTAQWRVVWTVAGWSLVDVAWRANVALLHTWTDGGSSVIGGVADIVRTHWTKSSQSPSKDRCAGWIHEYGCFGHHRRSCRQIFIAIVFAKLSSWREIDGCLETRAGSTSTIDWRFSRIVYTSTTANIHDRCLHAQRSPSTHIQFSMNSEIFSFLQLVFSIFLSLYVVVLYCIAINHHLEAAGTNSHRCSENDSFWNSLQHINLRKDCSSEEDVSCFLETGLT